MRDDSGHRTRPGPSGTDAAAASHLSSLTSHLRPTDIKLRRAQQDLRIRWADGTESVYPAALLRRNCPCATCRTAQRPASPTSLPILTGYTGRPVELTGAQLVGHYAIQLSWSDGHDTGIYDYRYLRTIEE